MNAEYVHKVFETAEQNGVDLSIALELLSGTVPVPNGVTKDALHAFIGLHENLLSRAYRTRHAKLFADIVAVCQEGNEDETDFLARARATGNDKLIEELEARYGIGGGSV